MPIYALGELEPTIDPTPTSIPDATVIGDVRLGAYASVWPQAVLRGDYGYIDIGERTSVQDGTVIHCTEFTPAVDRQRVRDRPQRAHRGRHRSATAA